MLIDVVEESAVERRLGKETTKLWSQALRHKMELEAGDES